MLVFGPVPSRRLGRSLGINNIPPKSCSYSCVYCQVGPTEKTETHPREFHNPEVVADAVADRVRALRERGEKIDYLTFVPDGEPTLDQNLDREITLLRPLGIPIAVVTNGSLLWRDEVRKRLQGADWVSVKVDAAREDVWRRINRPDPSLHLAKVQEGMMEFGSGFNGYLAAETMLVQELNDGADIVAETAGFLAELSPDKAYLAIPTRPMAEKELQPPDETTFNQAYQIFSSRLADVKCLTEEMGTDFGFAGDAEADLLGITAVHPMTEEAVRKFLTKSGQEWALIKDLIARGLLISVQHQDRTFYARRFSSRKERTGDEA